MKKYLFLILFLACPSLLCADTVYFKDGTSVEGKITSESDKIIVIKESKANVAKVCEYSKSKITKIEKKASKPTCNFSPRVSDKKNKAKDDKVAKEAKVKVSKAPVKATKIIQEAKPPEIKKAEPAKAAKPKKEVVAKPKAKEVKPKVKEVKPKAGQVSSSNKIKAQDAAFQKIEKKTAQKAPKPLPVSKPVVKKSAPLISVKPLKSAQEAELNKIEKVNSEKTAKKTKAQDAAFQKIEKKAVQKTPELAPVPVAKPIEAEKEIVQEKKCTFKYRTVGHDAKNLPEPRKMERIESSIVVPAAADNEELELIFSDLLEKELAANKKLDALWVIVYVEGEYPVGLPKAYGIWSPPGGWYDWKNTSDKSQHKWEYRFLRSDSIPR